MIKRPLVSVMNRSLLAAILLAFFGGPVFAQLPKPTHPNIVRLGYYFVNEKFGDDTASVWPYTNMYIAIPDNAADSSVTDWQTPFAAQLQKATLNHKAIYLIMGECIDPPCRTSWDAILDVAQNYWGQVAWIEIAHEAVNMNTEQQMTDRVALFNSKLAARGLPQRPLGAIFTTDAILTTNAITAPGIAWVNIEAYATDTGDTATNVANLNSYLATAKSRVRNAGKQIFLTMQAYDRSGLWSDDSRLEAIQRPVYLNGYDDPNVIGIQMFAYNRPTGTKDHPILQQAHREIGSVMGVSPVMNIDTPASGSTVGTSFLLAGWAIDRAAVSGGGTGVDFLQAWAFPTNGASPIFLGAPSYGGSRPDVGATFGSQFTPSGFGLMASLAPGQYWVVVYPHSTVSNTYVKEQVIVLNVQ